MALQAAKAANACTMYHSKQSNLSLPRVTLHVTAKNTSACKYIKNDTVSRQMSNKKKEKEKKNKKRRDQNSEYFACLFELMQRLCPLPQLNSFRAVPN